MRISTSLLAALATATGIAAQIPTDQDNDHLDYQTNTSYTTRSGVAGQSDGWIGARTDAQHIRGAAQFVDPLTGTLVHRIRGLRYVIQDQSGVTQEQFGIGVFEDDPANPGNPLFPDSTGAVAAGVAFTGINTPTSTVTTPVAWIFTSTFGDYDAHPATQDIYLGVLVPQNALWVNDGVSFHAPFWGNAGTTGDNPSNFAINNGSIPTTAISNDLTADPTGATLNTPLNDRAHRIEALGPGLALSVGADVDPAFQRGAANPNFGYGGLYPDQATRLDGLGFRLLDANLNTITATYGVIGSIPDATGSVFGQLGLPLQFGGGLYAGDLHCSFASLMPFDWLFGGGGNNAAGGLEATIIPFGALPGAPLGELSFQGVAFGLDPANGTPFIKASNAVRINSL